uniref:Uncharacterized protein n=1 Tax=Parascaris univalens TaxID=6257 RepID=A0A915AVP3_PARUN
MQPLRYFAAIRLSPSSYLHSSILLIFTSQGKWKFSGICIYFFCALVSINRTWKCVILK